MQGAERMSSVKNRQPSPDLPLRSSGSFRCSCIVGLSLLMDHITLFISVYSISGIYNLGIKSMTEASAFACECNKAIRLVLLVPA
ncbi:hypothetical protein EJ08DRAFT_220148 [Tothia fuscella]|uniref:Uncharacterized protein n=1 Tax=Tothia fuscella TaxID=1048955 RepID=A0A9P4P289_9PEZI|nr:hypothetical protein EJ08DRAFT_220148 [Tothia fuscella]